MKNYTYIPLVTSFWNLFLNADTYGSSISYGLKMKTSFFVKVLLCFYHRQFFQIIIHRDGKVFLFDVINQQTEAILLIKG